MTLRLAGALCALMLLAPLAGCETLGFYRQAAFGQLGLLTGRTGVERLLADPGTDAALARRIETASEIVDFAEAELGLAAGGRYRSYVELDRPYALWVVYAAPELAIEPRRWCYPLVGCAAYRGYFDETAARRFAEGLHGYDTHVAGVSAYSTLGWFNDPLLSSFIDRPDHALAAVLIHELAHGRLYLAGATAFNEAYATFVERAGTRAWLEASGRGASLARAERLWRDRDRFARFLLRWRARFAELYEQPYPPLAMRLMKGELSRAAETCYRRHRDALGGGTFDAFFAQPLNNARLAPVAVYDRHVPAFEQLFREADGDWVRFHAAAEELAALAPLERRERLAALSAAQGYDHGRARGGAEVHCDALVHMGARE